MHTKTIVFAVTFIAALAAPSAYAVLGGAVTATPETSLRNKSAARTVVEPQFTRHESQTSAGTTVYEYTDTNGSVFAVTWFGPFMPDLRQLLGPYFPQYINNDAQQSGGGHTARNVQIDDLVVHSGGRMRAFSGKAYLKSAVPEGVVIDALQ